MIQPSKQPETRKMPSLAKRLPRRQWDTAPIMDTEKYSLRQRQKRKHHLGRNNDCQGYASDNSTESLQNVRMTKSPSSSNNNNGKTKTKAAPLSKYRRKTANARERTRMREINSAFELLRHCVPTCITHEDAGSTNEKLTKITTLRLAMKYIGILSDALVNPQNADFNFLYDCTQSKPKDHSFMDVEEDIEVEEYEEEVIQRQKPSKVKSSKATKTSGPKVSALRKTNQPAKKQYKKQKTQQPEAMISSPIPAISQASPASNASSAYASLSSSDSSASPHSNSSYLFENNSSNPNYSLGQSRQHNSMSDLSNLMLESDGESLNLSERCLSPLHTNNAKPTYSSSNLYECSPSDIPSLENPLELSLRLMDPVVTESLRLSPVPAVPSSSCFSPLLNLEPFNTFDLFHSDFNEQTALDLFLT